MSDTHEPRGLIRAETTLPEEIDRLCARIVKHQDAHAEVFGTYCFVAEHIRAPYEAAFDYCADVLHLEDWTINIRQLRPVAGGLHRGFMVFSPEDAQRPSTEILIRADAVKGPKQGVICYPCAWDQGQDLWMRYYFTLADAQDAIAQPGTMVFWVNCKHPFYDSRATEVPPYIVQGRNRTDRPWAGAAWPMFSALHYLELQNLKRVLEQRYQ